MDTLTLETKQKQEKRPGLISASGFTNTRRVEVFNDSNRVLPNEIIGMGVEVDFPTKGWFEIRTRRCTELHPLFPKLDMQVVAHTPGGVLVYSAKMPRDEFWLFYCSFKEVAPGAFEFSRQRPVVVKALGKRGAPRHLLDNGSWFAFVSDWSIVVYPAAKHWMDLLAPVPVVINTSIYALLSNYFPNNPGIMFCPPGRPFISAAIGPAPFNKLVVGFGNTGVVLVINIAHGVIETVYKIHFEECVFQPRDTWRISKVASIDYETFKELKRPWKGNMHFCCRQSGDIEVIFLRRSSMRPWFNDKLRVTSVNLETNEVVIDTSVVFKRNEELLTSKVDADSTTTADTSPGSRLFQECIPIQSIVCETETGKKSTRLFRFARIPLRWTWVWCIVHSVFQSSSGGFKKQRTK